MVALGNSGGWRVLQPTQDKYQMVAEALQTAVTSLPDDEDIKYKDSFYY